MNMVPVRRLRMMKIRQQILTYQFVYIIHGKPFITQLIEGKCVEKMIKMLAHIVNRLCDESLVKFSQASLYHYCRNYVYSI